MRSSSTTFVLMLVVLLSWQAEEALSQSLFGNRGPIGNSSSFASPSLTAATAGTSTSPLLQAQQAQPSGFIGRGAPSQFVGKDGSSQTNVAGAGLGPVRSGEPASTRELNPSLRSLGESRSPGTQSMSRIRPRYRLAFEHPAVDRDVVQARLAGQLASVMSERTDIRHVAVHVDERLLATLEGHVASAETRKLLELLVRLEPGVRSVRNELMVASDGDAALPLSAGRH